MNKKTILSLIFAPLLFLLSSSCLFAGLTVVGQNYERTAYLNSHLFVDFYHPSIIFKYDAPRPITDEKTRCEFIDMVNSFDGETKYYNYACFFGVTDYATIGSGTTKYRLGDMNYLVSRSSYSTNLLKLASPNTYATAFDEEERVYIDASSVNLRKGDKLVLSSYFGNELIAEGVKWSTLDQTIAKIDSNGRIKGLKDGQTSVIAEYNETVAVVDVIVSSASSFKTEIKKIIPVVVPESFAKSEYGSVDNAIHQQLVITLTGKKYDISIGGVYQTQSPEPLYKNEFYRENIGDLFYFLRSAKYNLPISCYYATAGNKQKVNLNIHADIKFFKSITKLDFSIPRKMPTNNLVPTKLGTTLYKKVDLIKNTKFILNGVFLIMASLSVFFLSLLLFGDDTHVKKYMPEILLISSFLIPPLIAAIIRKVRISGIELLVSNSITGWIYIGCSLVLVVILLLRLIRKSYVTKKSEKLSKLF